jgi:hypothetical protein
VADSHGSHCTLAPETDGVYCILHCQAIRRRDHQSDPGGGDARGPFGAGSYRVKSEEVEFEYPSASDTKQSEPCVGHLRRGVAVPGGRGCM